MGAKLRMMALYVCLLCRIFGVYAQEKKGRERGRNMKTLGDYTCIHLNWEVFVPYWESISHLFVTCDSLRLFIQADTMCICTSNRSLYSTI